MLLLLPLVVVLEGESSAKSEATKVLDPVFIQNIGGSDHCATSGRRKVLLLWLHVLRAASSMLTAVL